MVQQLHRSRAMTTSRSTDMMKNRIAEVVRRHL